MLPWLCTAESSRYHWTAHHHYFLERSSETLSMKEPVSNRKMLSGLRSTHRDASTVAVSRNYRHGSEMTLKTAATKKERKKERKKPWAAYKKSITSHPHSDVSTQLPSSPELSSQQQLPQAPPRFSPLSLWFGHLKLLWQRKSQLHMINIVL